MYHHVSATAAQHSLQRLPVSLQAPGVHKRVKDKLDKHKLVQHFLSQQQVLVVVARTTIPCHVPHYGNWQNRNGRHQGKQEDNHTHAPFQPGAPFSGPEAYLWPGIVEGLLSLPFTLLKSFVQTNVAHKQECRCQSRVQMEIDAKNQRQRYVRKKQGGESDLVDPNASYDYFRPSDCHPLPLFYGPGQS